MTPQKDVSGCKRNNKDTSDNTPKPKRPRYVSNACDTSNECKRRKVRCDGQDPCQRCTGSMMPCSYYRPSRNEGGMGSTGPSSTLHLQDFGDTSKMRDREWHQMVTQIQTVMEKVDNLNDKLNAISPHSETQATQQITIRTQDLPEPGDLRVQPTTTAQLANPGARDQSLQPSASVDSETFYPEYHGPTSSEFTFEVANESLTELGVGCSIRNPNQSTKFPSFLRVSRNPSAEKTLLPRLLARDPLWTIERSDALKYIDTYHHTVGAMYPVASGHRLAPKVIVLLDSLDVARGRQHQCGFGRLIELMFSVDTQIIKIQLAIGMMTELGFSGTDVAKDLMQSVLDSSDDSFMHVEGLSGVQTLVSTALFYYHLDEELKASRYSCLASRRCLEMGLHRRETLLKHFPDEEARKEALRVFWSVFTLDRRSSLGLGVPFVIQDTLVDPALSSIEFDHAYLRAMIPFAKLSAKAWQMNNDFSSKEPDVVREEIDYLDYQVLQWQKQIPPSLRYSHGQTVIPDPTSSDADTLQRFYLSVVLSVRSNQLRNVIYRPLLQSASRINGDLDHTLTALGIAKDSLQAFSDLDATTSLLYTHSTFFKHFIVSSLGNLLLIVVHAPTEYWTEIRDTFHAASTLLRKLSNRSGPLLRAWDRFKGLEDLHAKILTARRAKAEAQHKEKDVNYHSGIRPNPSEGLPGLGNTWNIGVGGSVSTGEDYMLFDSQIRDGFAGLFDSSLELGDLYDFSFLEECQ